MARFDDKIDIKTIIILGGILLSTVVGVVRIMDTQHQMQSMVIKSDALNIEAHAAIGIRLTALERAQARQEGYNAAMAKIASEGGS